MVSGMHATVVQAISAAVSGPSVWIPHGCELEVTNAGLRSLSTKA